VFEAVTLSPDNVLTIAGARRRPARDQGGGGGGGGARRERPFGRASRRIRLPDSARADGITAALDAGVLTVRVPKAEGFKVQVKVKSAAAPAPEAVPSAEPKAAAEAPQAAPAAEGEDLF
jgi:HSP20 family protein